MIESLRIPPFARECRNAAASEWERSHTHPFVRALADGSLDAERFAFYQKQDARYLEGFCDACALISTRCEDPTDKGWFIDAAKLALEVESELHRGYGLRLGYTPADIRKLELTPNCRAYRAHMIEEALTGSLLSAVAALTPCPWLYVDLGQSLLRSFPGQEIPADHPYADWLKTYADPGFVDYLNTLLAKLESFAAEAGPQTRERAVKAFITSIRYEYLFWEQAWQQQNWG